MEISNITKKCFYSRSIGVLFNQLSENTIRDSLCQVIVNIGKVHLEMKSLGDLVRDLNAQTSGKLEREPDYGKILETLKCSNAIFTSEVDSFNDDFYLLHTYNTLHIIKYVSPGIRN